MIHLELPMFVPGVQPNPDYRNPIFLIQIAAKMLRELDQGILTNKYKFVSVVNRGGKEIAQNFQASTHAVQGNSRILLCKNNFLK